MADTSTDLLWDHSAENLEGNPLLHTYNSDTPTHQRHGSSSNITAHLSRYQVNQLIESLAESRELLQQYLSDFNNSDQEHHSQDTSSPQQSRLRRVCKKCSQALQKVTGTKTIIFTVVLQGLNLIIQTIIDIWSKKDDENILVINCITMIFLQLANLVFIILTSVKLADQLFHRKVNGFLLIQSYVAAILLFAGLYTVTNRLKPNSWKDVHEDVNENPGLVILLYTKFLYFSVSTATLCGTANTAPAEWYNYLLVAGQMLLSFMYFASILGHALTPFTISSSKVRYPRTRAAERELRTEQNSPLVRPRGQNHTVTGYGSIQ